MYQVRMVWGIVRAMSRTTTSSADRTGRRDGRDTRWEKHRIARRAELVESTLRAIRHHGAGVGMDEIAAEAGTSKTVIYRHYSDKAGLYVAVVAFVDDLILREITVAATDPAPDVLRTGRPGDHSAGRPEARRQDVLRTGRHSNHGAGRPAASGAEVRTELRRLMSAVVDTYLRLVERDPEVYRFVVTRPLLDRPPEQDPVAGMTGRIGEHVASIIAARLRGGGHDTPPAGPWGPGLVGLVRAVTDHWLAEPDPMPRPELVAHVTDLICGGLVAALEEG
jgi:AcrR family transcriptional regulator